MAAAAGITTTFHSTSATTIASSVNVTYSSTDFLTTLKSIEEEILDSSAFEEILFYSKYFSAVVWFFIGFGINSLLFNGIIVISSLWIKKPMSLNLSLIISLAGADTYNSLLNVTGLFINALLPFAFNVSIGKHIAGACFLLLFHMLSFGGILISVAHIFIFSLNNYLRIIWNIDFTPKITSLLITLIWSLPLAFLLIYSVSIEDQGFRSDTCDSSFAYTLKFRLLFVILFYLPFIFILLIHSHIYFAKRRCCRIARPSDEGKSEFSMSNISEEIGVDNRDYNMRSTEMDRNRKDLVTIKIIIITYIVGWMPWVFMFLTDCEGCPIQTDDLDLKVSISLNFLINFFLILKLFLGPIIYILRNKEIREALEEMKPSKCKRNVRNSEAETSV